MNVTLNPKTRIEMPNMAVALAFAQKYGGRIAKMADGRVFHYSHQYTMTDICFDMTGGAQIGGWEQFDPNTGRLAGS